MIVFPIASYFLTLNTLFSGKPSTILLYAHAPPTNSTGNSTFAGATAAIIANVVLIAYIIVAMKEDQGEREEADIKNKKSR